MTTQQLRSEYRNATRSERDTMWMMYIGMRGAFQQIEATAKNKCGECGHNPHSVYCSKHPRG